MGRQIASEKSEMIRTKRIRRHLIIILAKPYTIFSDTPDQYDFETVITSIKNSGNDQWLAKSSSIDESAPTKVDDTIISDLTTTFNEPTIVESKQPLRKRHFWYPTVGNQTTMNGNEQWLAKYASGGGGGGGDRPVNESAKDVATWESILGWQAILEKIHASGDDDWLVPASRNLNIQNE